MKVLSNQRARQLLAAARRARVLVIGDAMLDEFLWGRVSRISPEAPVPVVEFERESFVPGGAANVARNLSALGASVELFGAVGRDSAADHLRGLLESEKVGCSGLLWVESRMTTRKIRIIAHQQQVARVDRETRRPIDPKTESRLLAALRSKLDHADAVIVGDYGKGVITQSLLDSLKSECRERGLWISLDPKPTHALDLRLLSLITPNRKELFELAADLGERILSRIDLAIQPGSLKRGASLPAHPTPTPTPTRNPSSDLDPTLLQASARVLETLSPALLLVTLGDQGMLLCQRGLDPIQIPTVAREVFDVSGAGDTVIAAFTLAIVSGASPLEAALLSNHAAGVVVGKVGTAIVTPDDLLASLQ